MDEKVYGVYGFINGERVTNELCEIAIRKGVFITYLQSDLRKIFPLIYFKLVREDGLPLY